MPSARAGQPLRSIRQSAQVWAWLDKEADRLGVTWSEVVRRLVQGGIDAPSPRQQQAMGVRRGFRSGLLS